jgi:hypothetical protein
MNNYEIKVVKVQGGSTWQSHGDTDEQLLCHRWQAHRVEA